MLGSRWSLRPDGGRRVSAPVTLVIARRWIGMGMASLVSSRDPRTRSKTLSTVVAVSDNLALRGLPAFESRPLFATAPSKRGTTT